MLFSAVELLLRYPYYRLFLSEKKVSNREMTLSMQRGSKKTKNYLKYIVSFLNFRFTKKSNN